VLEQQQQQKRERQKNTRNHGCTQREVCMQNKSCCANVCRVTRWMNLFVDNRTRALHHLSAIWLPGHFWNGLKHHSTLQAAFRPKLSRASFKTSSCHSLFIFN